MTSFHNATSVNWHYYSKCTPNLSNYLKCGQKDKRHPPIFYLFIIIFLKLSVISKPQSFDFDTIVLFTTCVVVKFTTFQEPRRKRRRIRRIRSNNQVNEINYVTKFPCLLFKKTVFLLTKEFIQKQKN